MSNNEKSSAPPLLRRLLSSFPVVIEACLLALLIVLLADAFAPEFRGGWFVRVTLLIATGLAIAILIRDVLTAAAGQEIEPDRPAVVTVLMEGGEEDPEDWRTIAVILLTVAAMFLSLFIFGIPVGLTIACWVLLVWKLRVSAGRALVGALIFGIVIPVPFAYVLGLNMWPGVIPQIVPDWVGGGLPPPL